MPSSSPPAYRHSSYYNGALHIAHHVCAGPGECNDVWEDLPWSPGLDGTGGLSPPIAPPPMSPVVIHVVAVVVLISLIPLGLPVCLIYIPLV